MIAARRGNQHGGTLDKASSKTSLEAQVEIKGSFDFTAPPEVVFNSLVDPERTGRWVPSGVNVEWLDSRQVRVGTRSAGATFTIDTTPDELLLSWRSRDDQRVHGRIRAEDGPAGGSRLHVVATLPDGAADPDRGQAVLAEAMRHLQRDVSDNFNAG